MTVYTAYRPISRKVWYHLALATPVVLPAILWAFDALCPLGKLLTVLFFYTYTAVIFGGFQYVGFVGLIIWWGRNKTADQFRHFVWLWPIIYAPVCGLGLVLFQGMRSGWPNVMQGVPAAISIGLLSIPIGYFYVCVVIALTRLLQKAGWVI
jgi:hypothetical protein